MRPRMTRRQLLGGIAAALPLPLLTGPALADVPRLTAGYRTIEVKGRAARVFSLTRPGGAPGLDLVAGDRFRAQLVNETDVETLVHWHGLTPPVEQDGVPMLSQPPLRPGESAVYDFANTRTGTHWMHSHVGLQEQQMLAAPLIVRAAEADEQEHVVLLHDFTFRDPEEILAELRGGGGDHAGHGAPAGGSGSDAMDHASMGHGAAAGAMLNDIRFDAFLANDRTLDDPEIIAVERHGRLRLRIINAAAASNMWIDLGELQGDLVAVDGNDIEPLTGSVFPLAVAQRADIRLRMPPQGGAFPVLFRPEGVGARTGVILAAPGGAIGKVAELGDVAPALDLAQERLYRAVAKLPQEPVTRMEMVMLTGGGADYLWGLNGKSGMHDTVFTVREGEIIAVMMHNMTTMAHPMHLHGHHFKVTAIGTSVFDGAMRDTVLVPPGETVTITFHADNPGTWAFHCHHAYHMNSGMMGAVAYSSAA